MSNEHFTIGGRDTSQLVDKTIAHHRNGFCVGVDAKGLAVAEWYQCKSGSADNDGVNIFIDMYSLHIGFTDDI